ncbi:hypothetical protein [Desulfobulbus oligotrophicus]|uniref:Uncharacterized protein n=1 Tax=Desulfobulbus oligotrophicus TaxID=1909699 RepID=A0A7T6AQM9_9BACT|nr:hypothetical protein [Desulfobulbus oligotrophicus]QQG65643.1 hypothetical protein HP555_07065 [Desulfobulbus oligotrophicus]
MHDKKELCDKITALYPDIGACGMNVDVSWDEQEKMWVVHLEKDVHKLDHYLATTDADYCMDDKQCVSLGLEIAQLRKNIEGKQF